MTPGEDSEDELRLLAGLRRAGHDEVRAWLQPQLPTHFLLCEKLLRPIQGSIFPEEFRGQPPLVVIALGEGVGRGQQLSGSRRACGQAWALGQELGLRGPPTCQIQPGPMEHERKGEEWRETTRTRAERAPLVEPHLRLNRYIS